MNESLRIAVLTRPGQGVNAIHDASACLVEALGRRGCQARLVDWAPGSVWSAASDSDVLVVPYNPFFYGRWGFAPALVRDVIGVRRRSQHPLIVLVIHEPYVPITGWRSLLMGTWQRAQLLSLMLLADVRFASIESWAKKFSRVRPVGHLPSGSNLPDARIARESVRAELNVDGDVVVATLSTGHPSHLTDYVMATLVCLAAEELPITFLQLGAGAGAVSGIPETVRVICPGELDARRLASFVAASDIFLTPFIDGVSTRRGSFMAAIQHAIAVVGTRGELTDPLLLRANLELVKVGDARQYSATVRQLALDSSHRLRVAANGRSLFEAQFTWDRIADRLLAPVSVARDART